MEVVISGELQFAATKKLQKDLTGMKLYLEDGYEIDEDEILVSSVTNHKTLIVSSEHQQITRNQHPGLEMSCY